MQHVVERLLRELEHEADADGLAERVCGARSRAHAEERDDVRVERDRVHRRHLLLDLGDITRVAQQVRLDALERDVHPPAVPLEARAEDGREAARAESRAEREVALGLEAQLDRHADERVRCTAAAAATTAAAATAGVRRRAARRG